MTWSSETLPQHGLDLILNISTRGLRLTLNLVSTVASILQVCPQFVPKCQLISKCLFGVFNFLIKNERKPSTLLLWTMVPQVELFSFVFGRIEDTKKTFRN